jgi:N-acetylmuramate 1-kinase
MNQQSSQSFDAAQDVRAVAANFATIFLKATDIERIVPLAGDASSRRYYRIFGSGARQSWVLQQSEVWQGRDAAKHSFLSGQLILSRAGVAVPRVLATCPEKGWVLLEDLGDQTLQLTPTTELYQEALRMLVEWTVLVRAGSPKFSDLEIVAPHFAWAFDFEKLQSEMKHTADHLVSQYLQLDGAKFLTLVEGNSRWLAARPRFFCHRDFHSRNLMNRSNRLFAIDFQDARMGPITYDLVSLLWDPYVQLANQERLELLAYWKSQLKSRAVAESCSQALAVIEGPELGLELERMKVQRLLKAAGSYASFLNNKGRRDYLPSIAPALRESSLALERISEHYAASFTAQDAQLLTAIALYEERISNL